MRNEYAQRIKSDVTMRAACEKYGLAVNRAGFAVCPFHTEKTASLKVYPNRFYCFGCGAHGSVIDFVMQLFNLDFGAAIARLNYDFGLFMPIGERMTYREQKRMTEAARARKRQAEERRQRIAEADAEYERLFAAWHLLDVCYTYLKPKTPDEPLNVFFVMALQSRDYYEYLLDLKEEERRRLRGNADHFHAEPRSAGAVMDKGAVPVHDRAV